MRIALSQIDPFDLLDLRAAMRARERERERERY